jgi:hypothetical protein
VDVVKNPMTAASSQEGGSDTSTTDSGPSENLGQAFARDRVDAGLRRCRYRLMAGCAEGRDEL